MHTRRRVNTTLLSVLVTSGLLLFTSFASASDAVEKLREALREPLDFAAELKARQENLEKHVQALRGVRDFHKALALEAWRDNDPELGQVDGAIRAGIEKRLVEDLRRLLEGDDPIARFAAVTLIGELGTDLRATIQPGNKERKGAMRVMAPDLGKLLKTGSADLRPAVAASLSKINPDAKVAVPALADLLKDEQPGTRRAVAQAFDSLLLNNSELLPPGRSWGIAASWAEGLELVAAVAPRAASGLGDDDAEVRRTCANTLHRAASTLLSFLTTSRSRHRTVMDPLRDDLVQRQIELVEVELQAASSLAPILAGQIPALVQRLTDADVQTTLTANQTLESLADSRKHLIQELANKDVDEKQVGRMKEMVRVLGEALSKAVPALAKELSHADVQIRLAAIYVLESLQADSGPSVEAVTKTLRDADPFVRWGAARVLGNMISPQTKITEEFAKSLNKTAPELARLLDDENRDIRVTAAAALERFGPAAAPALTSIIGVISRGDPETQVLAIKALTAIGPDTKKAVVPALVNALDNKNASVRAAAADALGHFGPADNLTLPPLRNALADPSPEVRRAAADALLIGK